ncbi:MAG: hypothetical protein Q4F79_04735 [Eubacteriales bacterium]|nr:hypothetical protein [Eubacteriales bacterium]
MINHEKLFQTGTKIAAASLVLMIALWFSWPIASSTVRSFSGNDGLFDSPFLSHGALLSNIILLLFGLILMILGWRYSTSSRLVIQYETLFFLGTRILALALALFVVLLQAEVFLRGGLFPDPDAQLGFTPWWCTSDSPVYVLTTNGILFLLGLVCFLLGWFGSRPVSQLFKKR